ncbi:DUF2909 domain-containing protein [Pelomonas sp. KK5]|uniref:DUF2909 domain-containing protein n=1 Tax=Pelomonas sp. KK5 TaxID=1855730 RepID=UPI00097C6395|nr:DUF2909 domain-containing protein [Pelomonas sp. KK5]
MKLIVALALVGILAALAAAGFFMLKSRRGTRNMARALTVRIGVSVALFLFILLSWKMGWIEPGGLQLQQR